VEKKVALHLAERTHISRNVAQDFSAQLTFGQRLADKVASFGLSWTFISIFGVVMVIWVFMNSFVLSRTMSHLIHIVHSPEPFFIYACVSSSPIILMSQNRQAYKDRLNAEHDYEVNLKRSLK